MKQVKLTLSFALTLLFIASLQAQKGFYLNIRGGYGTPAVSDDMGSPLKEVGTDNYFADSTGNISEKGIYSTSGGGVNLGITAGYWFNEHLGVDASFNYVNRGSYLDAQYTDVIHPKSQYIAKQTSVNSGYSISPSIIFSTGNDKKLSAFTKVSIIIPVGGAITSTLDVHDGQGRVVAFFAGLPQPATGFTTELHLVTKTYSNPTYGFSGTLGLNYALTSHLNLFAQVEGVALTIKPKETQFDLTQYTQVTKLYGNLVTIPALTEYDQHYVYVDEMTDHSNNSAYNTHPAAAGGVDKTKPQERLAFKQNFNQIAFSIGVGYKF